MYIYYIINFLSSKRCRNVRTYYLSHRFINLGLIDLLLKYTITVLQMHIANLSTCSLYQYVEYQKSIYT